MPSSVAGRPFLPRLAPSRPAPPIQSRGAPCSRPHSTAASPPRSPQAATPPSLLMLSPVLCALLPVSVSTTPQLPAHAVPPACAAVDLHHPQHETWCGCGSLNAAVTVIFSGICLLQINCLPGAPAAAPAVAAAPAAAAVPGSPWPAAAPHAAGTARAALHHLSAATLPRPAARSTGSAAPRQTDRPCGPAEGDQGAGPGRWQAANPCGLRS